MKKGKTVFVLCIFSLLTITIPTAAQSITITQPNTEWHLCNNPEGFEPGLLLLWTKTGSMNPNVKIELFNSAGTGKIMDIAASTPNDGEYHWLFNNNLPAGSYRVKISTIDNLVSAITPLLVIQVCNPVGTVNVSSPTANETWCKGKTYVIRWTPQNPPPYYESNRRTWIYLRKASNPTSSIDLGNVPTDSGQFSWTIPYSIASADDYQIYFVALANCTWTSPLFKIKLDIAWLMDLLKQFKYQLTWIPHLQLRKIQKAHANQAGELDIRELSELLQKGKEKVNCELASGGQRIVDLGLFGPGTPLRSRVAVSRQAIQKNKGGFQLIFRNGKGLELLSHPVEIQERK